MSNNQKHPINNHDHAVHENLNIKIESPGDLEDKLKHVFGKASEYVLSDQEKKEGVETFKALVAKGTPSPYTGYVVSAKKFFYNQFDTEKYFHFANSVHRKKILQVALVACFIFAFVTGTAYASNTSLPGDFLYPIKTKVKEPLETILAVGPKAKAKVAVKHAIERVKEASQLSVKGEINQKNESSINSDIIKKSEEARESIIKLNATGNTNAVQAIQVKFENSVNVYRKEIETSSKFNSTANTSKVLQTIDDEIQRIVYPQINDTGDDVKDGLDVLPNKGTGKNRSDFKKKSRGINSIKSNSGMDSPATTSATSTIETTKNLIKQDTEVPIPMNTPGEVVEVQLQTNVSIPTSASVSSPAPVTPVSVSVPVIVPSTPTPPTQVNLNQI